MRSMSSVTTHNWSSMRQLLERCISTSDDLQDGNSRNAMDAGPVAGPIVTLARLDAFIATAVSRLRENGSDNVGVTDGSFIKTR